MGARPLTLSDVEVAARERLEPLWYEYFAGGSGGERTLRENVSAFAGWRLRQRVLTGIEVCDPAVTVLGSRLGSPVVVAPVAYQRFAHADGEQGLARAAAAAGSAYCLSTLATAAPASVAEASPDVVLWYQVYAFRDRGVTDELIAQALHAGATALVLTVDLPVLGPRDRERRAGWLLPEAELPAVSFARERGSPGDGVAIVDPTIDWRYLDHLCGAVSVPVVVKGILEPEDAIRAAEHGAAGVVVSNHGGRQLDGVTPTIEALPGIVAAIGDRSEVLVDGGIRRGADVALALALGARAVLAGRMPIWGLAAGGEEGARTVLELLRDETALALLLMGCSNAEQVGRDHVVRVGAP